MIRLILEEGWMERKDMNEQFLIDDAYWNGIAPREKLLNMIAANYANPKESASYQAGTDMVILSAKYGKTKLPMAKILAGVLFGVAAFTIHVAVVFGITIAAFGIDGWNLPLQINGTAVPYPFTFLQGILVNLCVIYLVLIAMISLTLFLSPNGTSGIYNLLIFLTPYQSLIPRFGSYISYQFGPLVFDVFSMRIIMCLAAVLILLPLTKIGFQHHQAV